MTRAVAITGLGAVTPLGVGAERLVDRWHAGDSGIEDGLGRCSEFDPAAELSRRDARRSARFTQMAMVAADEALAQAGWDESTPAERDRLGCVIGTGIGGLGTIEEGARTLEQQGASAISPLCVPTMMANAASGAIAIRHDLEGQCFGTVSACAAGAQAIGVGMRMVACGDVAACVVGGSEAAITPLAVAAFGSMGATSPSGVSRPFDARRDGFVIGEGAGVLVLEDAELAAARGARPLAYLRGYGASADAHHMTAPDPDGAGAVKAIAAALADAELSPDELDYVNAHGTSTPLNDLAETKALKTALGERATAVPVSSLKSSIGHLLGAAGAVEAVATVECLRRAQAGPTLNLDQPDAKLDLDYVPKRARTLPVNGHPLNAISNSFGFGGHNVVLAIGAAA